VDEAVRTFLSAWRGINWTRHVESLRKRPCQACASLKRNIDRDNRTIAIRGDYRPSPVLSPAPQAESWSVAVKVFDTVSIVELFNYRQLSMRQHRRASTLESDSSPIVPHLARPLPSLPPCHFIRREETLDYLENWLLSRRGEDKSLEGRAEARDRPVVSIPGGLRRKCKLRARRVWRRVSPSLSLSLSLLHGPARYSLNRSSIATALAAAGVFLLYDTRAAAPRPFRATRMTAGILGHNLWVK